MPSCWQEGTFTRQMSELTYQLSVIARKTSTNTQRNDTVVAIPPEANQAVPPTRKKGHATAKVHKVPSVTRQDSITGKECQASAEAKAPAPPSGVNNRFSREYVPKPLNQLLNVKLQIDHSAAIEKMKSAIKQIQEPIYENRIKDFVRGKRFGDWLTSEESDALVVNNHSVNLSPDGVSLLTEFTLLLYEQLSILPKDEEAFTFMYFCAQYPATVKKMTTMRRMMQDLTSELYGYDCEHWDKQDFVREFSRSIREYNPENDNGDEKNNLLIDLFHDMLKEAQRGQAVYILIDGFDFVERDKSGVNQRDFWEFYECLYGMIEKLRNLDWSCPLIKVLVTYHETCPPDTRGYWKEYAVDLP